MQFLTRYFDTSKVRSFTNDQNIEWFNGTDICRVLGYTNPSVVIGYNVEQGDKCKFNTGDNSQAVWFINVCGVYELILTCNKDVAKPFSKWLSSIMLPQLENKGYYIAKKDAETLALLKAEIKELEEANQL